MDQPLRPGRRQDLLRRGPAGTDIRVAGRWEEPLVLVGHFPVRAGKEHNERDREHDRDRAGNDAGDGKCSTLLLRSALSPLSVELRQRHGTEAHGADAEWLETQKTGQAEHERGDCEAVVGRRPRGPRKDRCDDLPTGPRSPAVGADRSFGRDVVPAIRTCDKCHAPSAVATGSALDLGSWRRTRRSRAAVVADPCRESCPLPSRAPRGECGRGSHRCSRGDHLKAIVVASVGRISAMPVCDQKPHPSTDRQSTGGSRLLHRGRARG